jgi:hypothetical protein
MVIPNTSKSNAVRGPSTAAASAVRMCAPVCTRQTYNGLKMRFSVTLGEEPDMDVELA